MMLDSYGEMHSVSRSAERLVLLGRHEECVKLCCDFLKEALASARAAQKVDQTTSANADEIPALKGVHVRWRLSGRTNDPFLSLCGFALISLYECDATAADAKISLETIRASILFEKSNGSRLQAGIPFSFAMSWVRALLRCEEREKARALLEEHLTASSSVLERYASSEDAAYHQLYSLAEAYVLGALVPLGHIDDASEALRSFTSLRTEDVEYLRRQLPPTAAPSPSEAALPKDSEDEEAASHPSSSAHSDAPRAHPSSSPRTVSPDIDAAAGNGASPKILDSWTDLFTTTMQDMTAERAGAIAAATAILGISVHYRRRLAWIPRTVGRAIQSGGDMLFGQ